MRGTLVRLFPQSQGFPEPVRVELSRPTGSLLPGPTDAIMRTVLPLDKQAPYDPPAYMPPYRGAVLPPAEPDAAGNFDQIPTDAPQFLSQHLYGGIRRTLDVWERYLGRPVVWWHADAWPQLEIVPLLNWNNAHSGPGFVETGVRETREGVDRLFALNLDVIAHETGHAILFAEVGVPAPDRLTAGYLAFQESFSDIIALINALSFPQVIDRLFAETDGNLYVLNLVSRIAELSQVEQIRVADNTVTIDEVADMRLTEDGEWIDPSGQDRTVHDSSLPLTGAIFDVLVDLFQDNLVAAGVISPVHAPRDWDPASVNAAFDRLAAVFGSALAANRPAFWRALVQARDAVGLCMARTMLTVGADDLTFDAVAACMMRSAYALGLRGLHSAFLENFLLRGIDPRPALSAPAVPADWRNVSYSERRARVAAFSQRRTAIWRAEHVIDTSRLFAHERRTLEGAENYG